VVNTRCILWISFALAGAPSRFAARTGTRFYLLYQYKSTNTDTDACLSHSRSDVASAERTSSSSSFTSSSSFAPSFASATRTAESPSPFLGLFGATVGAGGGRGGGSDAYEQGARQGVSFLSSFGLGLGLKLGEGLGFRLAEEEDADTGLGADNYASGDGDETSSEEEEEGLLLSAGLPASGRCAGEGKGAGVTRRVYTPEKGNYTAPPPATPPTPPCQKAKNSALRKTCSTPASRCAQQPPPAQPHEAPQPPPHAPAEGADACDAHAEVKVGALSFADRKPIRRHARYSGYLLC
jgi:hypothetical protein